MVARILNLIVKTTNQCNLACSYCYADSGINQSKISLEIMEKFYRIFEKSSLFSELNIIWHGGEPLLLGVDFYSETIKMQKQIINKVVKNGFQSNLTLLSDDFIALAHREKISIGTSLDGFGQLNDTTRVFPDGRGTFDLVFQNLQRLKKEKLSCGCIVVLNRNNIYNLPEIVEAFNKAEISLKLNPIFPQGRGSSHFTEIGITPQQYAAALIGITKEYILNDNFKINIDPINKMIGNLVSGNPTSCVFLQDCHKSFLSIDYEGSISHCGRYDQFSDVLAQIHSLDDFDIVFDYIQESKSELCSECDFKSICNSGCPRNRINGKDRYCESYRELYCYLRADILPIVEKELRNAEICQR